MEQMLLFSDENVFRCRWDKCLRAGEFAGLENALQEQASLFPNQPGLIAKREAMAALRTILTLPPEEDAAQLAILVRMPDVPASISGLQSDAQAIQQGLWALLGKRLVPERTAPFANGLLPAEIVARNGNWPLVETRIANSLRDLGEHALLRQLQAFTAYRKNQISAAWNFLSLALFHDAAACQVDFLFPELVPEYQHMRQQSESDAEAWTSLAFRTWQKGILPIAPANSAFEAFLAQRMAASSSGSPEQRFLRSLYLAEAARARHDSTSNALAWRKAMQSLRPDWFSEYMATLEN